MFEQWKMAFLINDDLNLSVVVRAPVFKTFMQTEIIHKYFDGRMDARDK